MAEENKPVKSTTINNIQLTDQQFATLFGKAPESQDLVVAQPQLQQPCCDPMAMMGMSPMMSTMMMMNMMMSTMMPLMMMKSFGGMLH